LNVYEASDKTSASGARGMGSYPELIKSPTCCQWLIIVATLIVWVLVQNRGDGHRSLVTPERVLSKYNEDLIFFNCNFMQLNVMFMFGPHYLWFDFSGYAYIFYFKI